MDNKNFFPRAAVFDLDGTMFDSERVVAYSWNIVGKRMGLGEHLGDEHIRNTLGMTRATRKQYFLDQFGKDFPYDEFQEAYPVVYMEYDKTHGVPVKEGLYELLDALDEKKIPAAVATSSSPDHAYWNLERAGIRDRFAAIITGEMVKEGKPSPEIYLTACSKLGISPEEAMALEDATSGILSASRAGMYTVLIPDLLKEFGEVRKFVCRQAVSLKEVAAWIRGECGLF